MWIQCTGRSQGGGRVEGRQVALEFDGGPNQFGGRQRVATAPGRSHLRLAERVAACFEDRRDPELIEHRVRTLAMQNIVAIALG